HLRQTAANFAENSGFGRASCDDLQPESADDSTIGDVASGRTRAFPRTPLARWPPLGPARAIGRGKPAATSGHAMRAGPGPNGVRPYIGPTLATRARARSLPMIFPSRDRPFLLPSGNPPLLRPGYSQRFEDCGRSGETTCFAPGS